MPLAIALADDSLIVREGVEQILAASRSEVVASCGDLDSLLEAVERERPTSCVTDIRMPPDAAPTRASESRRCCARATRRSASSSSASTPSPATRSRCWSRAPTGAATCSRSGSTTARSCVAAIEAVAAGGAVIDPKIVEALVRRQGAAPSARRSRS